MSSALEHSRTAAAVEIEARELWHHFTPGRGLQPIDFSIRAPGAVAIIGPNGSGKSTLLRLLAGLLRPSGGELRFDVDGQAIGAATRRRHVGFASPELMFYDELSAAENLRFVCEARGVPEPRAAVQKALVQVGLGRHGDDAVSALSSGMKQRLRIAFALLDAPSVLLLDEPGGHLDQRGAELVADVVAAQRRSALVIVATNDEKEMALAEQRIELSGHHLGDPS